MYFCSINWKSSSAYINKWIHGALTLRPPTNRPRDIPTHTIHPPNILSTVTIFKCDTSTMWHFSTVTFRLCDNFILQHFDHGTFFYCDIPTMWQFPTVTLLPCDILLLRHSDSVTIFHCDILSQSGQIVRPPQKVDGLSHCDIPTHCNFGQPMAVTFCPSPVKQDGMLPGGYPVTCDKTSTFRFRAKVDVLSPSRKKRWTSYYSDKTSYF
jgi:hypothetical protein